MFRTTASRNRWAGLAGAALLASAALSACGGSEVSSIKPGEGDLSGEELVSAAQEEGKVSFYCSVVPEQCNALKEGFEAKYDGITIEVNRQTSSDISSRYASEKQSKAPTADVLLHSDYPFIATAMEDGLVTSFEDAGYLPADYPGDWVDGATGAPFFTEVLGIAYNTSKVKEGAITGWDSLLDPALKGRLTSLDVTALPVANVLYGTVGDAEGRDFIEALAEQEVVPNHGGMVALTESVGAGEYSVQVFASKQVVDGAAAKGSPVKIIFPDNATGSPFFFSLNPEPARGYAQQLFAEYVVSPDAQKALAAVNDSIAAAWVKPEFNTIAPDMTYFSPKKQEEIIAIMK